MADRLYVVEDDTSMTIVRAVSEARALTHVVKGHYKTRKASADDVAEYMTAGGKIEVADNSVPPLPAGTGEQEPDPE